MRIIALCVLAGLALAAPARAADIKSISRITFGPDNTLFVADWKAARVHALHLPAAAPGAPAPYNVMDLPALVGRALGGGPVTVEDMAARPGSNEVYVAVSAGAARTPALVAITPAGAVHRVDLKATQATTVTLDKAPPADRTFWKTLPERSFTVTDMKWHAGELFVAGLSNQDFSSTLRRIPYPFDGKASMASIEIYHTTHNQLETRAPIRAMTFADLDGKPSLIAAYTCTPLVTLPLAELVDGAHVRGKTIAELGYGNTPADMITFTQKGKDQDVPYVLLVNYELGSDLIPLADIQAASARPALDKQVPFGAVVGLTPRKAPLGGVTRIDNLDDHFFVVIRHELESGRTQLVTLDKNIDIRLSDFLSEYDFPAYDYTDTYQRTVFKPIQDELMKQEGFADLIKP